jgi:hypothetical protein
MPLPAGSDKTTDTDKSALAAAAIAKLPLVKARHKPGASEHPAGRTEPADSRMPTRAARREPHAGSSR